jgi:hypothetical protein
MGHRTFTSVPDFAFTDRDILEIHASDGPEDVLAGFPSRVVFIGGGPPVYAAYAPFIRHWDINRLPYIAREWVHQEIACALISMVARSMTRSNVRPGTLMQDPHPTDRRKPLATRGRTIHQGQTQGRLALISARHAGLRPCEVLFGGCDRSGSLAQAINKPRHGNKVNHTGEDHR